MIEGFVNANYEPATPRPPSQKDQAAPGLGRPFRVRSAAGMPVSTYSPAGTLNCPVGCPTHHVPSAAPAVCLASSCASVSLQTRMS